MKVSDTDHRTNDEAADATGSTKFVYGFSEDPGTEDDLVALYGGKGAGLMRMRQLGLPVPEGFVITTEACTGYLESGELPEGLMDQVMEHLERLEEATGRGFGDPEPAAGLGQKRSAHLYAGDDGHRPEPRPQRRHRSRAGEEYGGRALRPGLSSALYTGIWGDRLRSTSLHPEELSPPCRSKNTQPLQLAFQGRIEADGVPVVALM